MMTSSIQRPGFDNQDADMTDAPPVPQLTASVASNPVMRDQVESKTATMAWNYANQVDLFFTNPVRYLPAERPQLGVRDSTTTPLIEAQRRTEDADLDPYRGDLGPYFGKLPIEILEMIVKYAEPGGYWKVRTAFIYEDLEDVDGGRGISEPSIPPLAQTTRLFRCLAMKSMFKGRDLYMVHNEISQSVELLNNIYPSTRNVIEGILILIHDQQTPVNPDTARQLCETLKSMKALKVLCVGGFVEGDWRLQVKYPGETWFSRISHGMRVAEPFEWHYAHRARLIRYHVAAGGAGKTQCFTVSRQSRNHPADILQRWMEDMERERLAAAQAMFLV